MAEAVFHAERQYVFCQFAQRKFIGEKAGLIYDYYHVRTDLPYKDHDEKEMFEIISGYFLYLKFRRNPEETCFKMIPEPNGMWGFSFRWYRKMNVSVPEQEVLSTDELKGLFQKYMKPEKEENHGK